MTPEQLYQRATIEGLDIRAHLPRLRWLASIHTRVTEFGVRDGVSTIALLSGNPGVVSYDLEPSRNHDHITGAWPGWKFEVGDTTQITIDDTDLLFIDTDHTYETLRNELFRHAPCVTRTIALHDTYCQVLDGHNDPAGMWRAIGEFLQTYRDWRVVFDEPECNGLTILGRQ